MSNISEIGIAIRLSGASVEDFASRIKRRRNFVSQVINGKLLNEHIEKEVIKAGHGYLLMKVQINNGIFDRERYDRLTEEVKQESK